MPRLPTFELTEAVFAEVVNAFGGEDGYRAAVLTLIEERVLTADAQKFREEQNAALIERQNQKREDIAEVFTKHPDS